jgi:hypothetical protein
MSEAILHCFWGVLSALVYLFGTTFGMMASTEIGKLG